MRKVEGQPSGALVALAFDHGLKSLELGIPCVNGIPNAVELLEEGEIVAVDGYLDIVTSGAPEFDLEAA